MQEGNLTHSDFGYLVDYYLEVSALAQPAQVQFVKEFACHQVQEFAMYVFGQMFPQNKDTYVDT